MVIREATYYAFTGSAEPSVFSCETHLNWHWYLSRPNSAEWWNPRSGRIRISTSLDMELSWLDYDFQTKIGTTLTLTRNHNQRQWCDICKGRWGQLKNGEWHPLAQSPAFWRTDSQSPNRKGVIRFYCQPCANEIQNWPDGTFYSLKEQLLDALSKYSKNRGINVELPR